MFCINCGTKIEESSKFCINCGEKINGTDNQKKEEIKNTPKENIVYIGKDKTPLVSKSFLEKKIKKVGHISILVGWIQIATILAVSLWSISDKNFSDSGLLNPGWFGFLFTCGVGIAMVVLGKQIKQLKNVTKNIWILLSLCIIIIIIAGILGGGVGLITLILIGYLGGGIPKAKKLDNNNYDNSSVEDESNNNKPTVYDIIVYCLIGIFILGIISSMILVSLNSGKQIDTNNGAVKLSRKEIKNNDICNEKILNSQWDGKNYGLDYLPVCVCKGELRTSKDGLSCIDQDGVCNEAYQNTKLVGKDEKGAFNCDCIDGYKWNKELTACFK